MIGVDASPVPDAEAQELLEQGLRILARLAVRAYPRQEASLPATDSAARLSVALLARASPIGSVMNVGTPSTS